MKRVTAILTIIFILLSVVGCAEVKESVISSAEPSQQQIGAVESSSLPLDENLIAFTKSTYPKMGGSLAALPLGTALTANVLGLSADEAARMLTFDGSTTSNYERLRDGTFDIILAYEPAREVTYTDEFEFAPLAMDALVFITGKDNPVENLTSAQIEDIYNGNITNWNEVGGEDKKIDAYVRNTSSGSHALFELFYDIEKEEYGKRGYVDSMGGLLDAVATYKGEGEALGYTVYYYLTDMMASTLDTSKIIAVDGVMPTTESIASGEYSLGQDFYVVIRKSAPEKSYERILFNWIASEQGRQIAKTEGYPVPIE